MSIDLTGLKHLGSVGLEKILTEIPKGQAKAGIQFAFKIKIAAWKEGKYGYRYHLDVVIRTLDMQAVLASLLWKVYPSFLPQDITEAIDTDDYGDTWWLVYTEDNPASKAEPKRTRLHLIDTQQGLDAHSGPPKPSQELHTPTAPAVVESAPVPEGRGQPAPGEDNNHETSRSAIEASPGTPCPHLKVYMVRAEDVVAMNKGEGFYCKDCGERVG